VKIIPILLASLCCVTALAKDKPKTNMELKNALTAYWNMQQDPALFTVWDKVWPHTNKLTANGFDPDLTPPGSLVAGKLGKAIQFNGVDQWLSIASNAGVNHNGGEFTGAMWFKPIALAHAKRLIGSVDWGVNIIGDGANHVVNVSIEEGSISLTDTPLIVGQWYFLCFGWYGSVAPDETGTYSWASLNMGPAVREFRTAWSDPEGPFTIGGTSSGARVAAIIDDTAIWRRRVTAAELSAIYNDGDGLPLEEWDRVKVCKSITCCP
jgi:hypothetical protein